MRPLREVEKANERLGDEYLARCAANGIPYPPPVLWLRGGDDYGKVCAIVDPLGANEQVLEAPEQVLAELVAKNVVDALHAGSS